MLQGGGSALDAVEQGVRLVESSGNSSVGLSGKPNAAGVVQLDACIMNGPGHQAGSVAGVEGVLHPISAARLVMEKTPHVMLVGPGAHWFAKQNGLEVRDGQADVASYRAWLAKQKKPAPGKGDKPETTIPSHCLILDADGNIAGGCSTSGWSGKVPGRVGDSPIIGGGVYVDNEVGAASHRPRRERHALLRVVSGRRKHAPRNVADRGLRRGDPPHRQNRSRREWTSPSTSSPSTSRGEFGAAGTQANFPYSVTTPDFSEIRQRKKFKRGENKRKAATNKPRQLALRKTFAFSLTLSRWERELGQARPV